MDETHSSLPHERISETLSTLSSMCTALGIVIFFLSLFTFLFSFSFIAFSPSTLSQLHSHLYPRYWNLTEKVIYFLHWINKSIPSSHLASHVIVCDDDVYINVSALALHLHTAPRSRYYAGQVIYGRCSFVSSIKGFIHFYIQ